MKKRTIVTALLGVVLAACGNGTTAPPDENPFVYSDVVDGKKVEVTVSRAQPDEDTTAPEAGDFFVIRAEGKIVSKGTITALDTGGKAAFTPPRGIRPGPGPRFREPLVPAAGDFPCL